MASVFSPGGPRLSFCWRFFRSPEILAPPRVPAVRRGARPLARPKCGVVGRVVVGLVVVRIRKTTRDDVRERGHEAVGVAPGSVARGEGEVAVGGEVRREEGPERILDVLILLVTVRIDLGDFPVLVVGNRA